MKMEVNINSDILVWAIERAGIDIDKISGRIPNFSSWITGEKKPTLKQLETFSQRVHLPFGYLFLEKPPDEKLPIPFFRTVQQQLPASVSLNVYDSILIIQKRQEWLSDYLRDSEYKPRDFVGKFVDTKNVADVVTDIRKTLKLNEGWANDFPNWEIAKDHFAQQIEESGIITVFSGIVGNNTRRSIPVEECRGFVLVNNYAPFMFINAADSKSAQMFTMAHELAHIWIGKSAGFDFRQLQPANNPSEILCDQIAAELLVPAKILQSVSNENSDLEYLAKYFKVSQIVVARRLLDLGKMSRNDFFKFFNDYIHRDFQKKEDSEPGGDFYRTQRKRLSVRFLSFVNQAIKENKLLIRDAYQITDMRGSTFHKFMKEHLH